MTQPSGDLRRDMIDKLTSAGVILSYQHPNLVWRPAGDESAEMIADALLPEIAAELVRVRAATLEAVNAILDYSERCGEALSYMPDRELWIDVVRAIRSEVAKIPVRSLVEPVPQKGP